MADASCCPSFAAGYGVHYSNCENYDPAKDAEALPEALVEFNRRTVASATPPPLPHNPQPKPWRCPVCGGRGTMPHDFYTNIGYSTSTNPVTCRSCGGRGVLYA